MSTRRGPSYRTCRNHRLGELQALGWETSCFLDQPSASKAKAHISLGRTVIIGHQRLKLLLLPPADHFFPIPDDIRQPNTLEPCTHETSVFRSEGHVGRKDSPVIPS